MNEMFKHEGRLYLWNMEIFKGELADTSEIITFYWCISTDSEALVHEVSVDGVASFSCLTLSSSSSDDGSS